VHRIYPCLLSGVVVERPNQVWACDITYLPMAPRRQIVRQFCSGNQRPGG